MSIIRYVFVALSCVITLNNYGMEPKTVTISSITKAYIATLPVDSETTIRDLKDRLHESEGIPAERQHLYALERHPWITWATMGYLTMVKPSEPLADDANVAFVMDTYNAEEFRLSLILRQAQ